MRGTTSVATISSHAHSVWSDWPVTNIAAQVANCAKFYDARNITFSFHFFITKYFIVAVLSLRDIDILTICLFDKHIMSVLNGTLCIFPVSVCRCRGCSDERQMQNDMPMVTRAYKSEPAVEFRHGGRLFSETGSSNISAVDRDISSKCGV